MSNEVVIFVAIVVILAGLLGACTVAARAISEWIDARRR